MLVLPEPYHNWRFYKIIQSDGRVRQIRDQIRDLSELEALINKVGNVDVYHSIAYYSNPSRVSYNDFRGKKAGYQQADNLLINGDIVFDIDARNRSLSSARTDAIECRDLLLEKGYLPIVVFSGRGFHLRVLKHDLELKEELPQNRLGEYRKLREPLVSEIKSKGVEIDSGVTLNPKGLIRLIGSTNSKTGTIVALVDSLEKFDVERMSPIATQGSATLRGNDIRRKKKDQDSPAGPGLSEQADIPTQFLFIGTQVIGTVNRETILLRFPAETPLDIIRDQLGRFLEKHNLAPFSLFESLGYDRAYFALSPSAVEKEHLPKLLRNFPEAKAAYQRFSNRHLPLPVRYICEVGSWNDKNCVVSLAHSNLLRRITSCKNASIICGNPLLNVGIGETIT